MALTSYTIASLYRFTSLENPEALKQLWSQSFLALELSGTLLVAPEGVNGTLAGSETSIEKLLSILAEEVGLTRDDVKFSTATKKPFRRLKVRLKRELITFKQPSANPTLLAGTYVNAKDWNKLIASPDVTVLDTRNNYETMIGTFKGAADPNIECFTDFANFVKKNLDPNKHKKIAMYCTGGIRCEKASAYMRANGFPEVYHLKGGILKYLEEIPPEDSQWQGECYVFDRRMSVGHGLSQGHFTMCYSCGYPLSEADKKHPHYEEGVSCTYCFSEKSEEDKARFRTRQQQLARKGKQ